MTTSLPIDGHLRDLLERVAKYCEFWHSHPYLGALKDIGLEARALLDKETDLLLKVDETPAGYEASGELFKTIIGAMNYAGASPVFPLYRHAPAGLLTPGAFEEMRRMVRSREAIIDQLRALPDAKQAEHPAAADEEYKFREWAMSVESPLPAGLDWDGEQVESARKAWMARAAFGVNAGPPHLELDGRLREILNQVLAHHYAEDCQECGIGQSEAWKELRALMDKDVDGDSHAPQPQGDTVKPYGYMFHPDGKKDEEFFIYEAPQERVPDHRGQYWTATPLYEQPAPVAVVMPERREIGPNYPYLSDLDIERNTCLDEVTRLNPSK